jgi:hypothetical protein
MIKLICSLSYASRPPWSESILMEFLYYRIIDHGIVFFIINKKMNPKRIFINRTTSLRSNATIHKIPDILLNFIAYEIHMISSAGINLTIAVEDSILIYKASSSCSM